jgi:D-alanine-D-alanine ligase
MDKEKSLKLFKKAGLTVADFVTNVKKIQLIGLPLVIKPLDRGSSVGVSIVKSFSELVPAIKLARNYSSKIMAQKYIKGREYTCGVIDYGKNTIPLLPTEIIPKKSVFFDYAAKYNTDASSEITPPRLPHKKIGELQGLALKTHKAIGARGLSRTDFIKGKDGKFYVLEINTLPGMTETSLLPQAARAVGINFPELLDIIIDSAMR